MRKRCDLCGGEARMHCESDKAYLCWKCDTVVHGANFLVARHTRRLLCAACESLTPWAASGAELGPSVSVCHSCASLRSDPRGRSGETNMPEDFMYPSCDEDDGESYDDDGNEESDLEDYDDEEDEDAENQVVPWTSSSQSLSRPPESVAYSSSSNNSVDQLFMRDSGSIMQRRREDRDYLCSDDEIGAPVRGRSDFEEQSISFNRRGSKHQKLIHDDRTIIC